MPWLGPRPRLSKFARVSRSPPTLALSDGNPSRLKALNGLLSPLGRVTHHFRPPRGAFSLCPGRPATHVLRWRCRLEALPIAGGAVEHGCCRSIAVRPDARFDTTEARGGSRKAVGGIHGGMSGSPILTEDGAIGVLCTSGGVEGAEHASGGPNPRFDRNLPRGLWRQLSPRG